MDKIKARQILAAVNLLALLVTAPWVKAADGESAPEDETCRYLQENLKHKEFPGGWTYLESVGLLYVPNECNEQTRCCLYYAGGGGDEDYLYYRGVYYYLETYQPNALILFFYGSGFSHKDEVCRQGAEVLLDVAQARGITLHDMITVGSSNGAYAALRASAILYMEYDIPVRRVLILAAGMDWEYPVSELLSDEQCEAVRQARTQICLFERKDVDLRVPAIRRMVHRGVHVTLMACTDWDHNQISVDAYKNGLFSWGFEEYPRLDPAQYRSIRLWEAPKHRRHDLTALLQ